MPTALFLWVVGIIFFWKINVRFIVVEQMGQCLFLNIVKNI